MPTLAVNLIKGDRIDQRTDYRDALPVNMYAVERDILGAKGYMLCYPGLSHYAAGPGPDRGAVYNERQGRQFRVSGERLISVVDGGHVVDLGMVSGATQAAMPYSFNSQAIISDGKMWLYNGALTQVTDPDLGAPIDGVWVDGYYFLTDGEYIYHTDLTNEASIDPLKFATAEFMPDPSLGVGKTQDNKVVVFGRYTIEYFVNQALENFAFRRVESRAQKIGIVSTHAKCEAGGVWYITGGRKDESLGVHVVGIGSSAKISTREVDKILSQYSESDLSDMRMESFSMDDTSFVLVHLPIETLCFNVTIAGKFGIGVAWTQLKTGAFNANYRAINGIFDGQKWIFGDKVDGRIGVLDNAEFAQYGHPQEFILHTPFVDLESMSVDEIEVETIPGNNTVDDATVALSLTYDGQTHGTEWWQMYSTPKDYGKRFIIRRLGYVDSWVSFRLRSVTKSRMAFSGMSVTYG